MNLLALGLELLRDYERKLSRRESISPQDLRLATWAVETTYRHRHHTPARNHILTALNALHLHTGDFETDNTQHSKVHRTLANVNEQLSEVVKDTSALPSGADPAETLRIPKVIINRLRNENGIF